MLVGVLGEVTLLDRGWRGGRAAGAPPPALLAALVARAGEVVSADRWPTCSGTTPSPRTARGSLHSAVFKLRASLGR